MSKLKKGFMKRVMAVILSGAMVMSNMTVFASEASVDTGGYVEEFADDDSRDADTDSKSADNESADKDDVEKDVEEEVVAGEAVVEKTTKNEDNASNGNDDADVEKTSVETSDAEVSDSEPASETKSSLSVEDGEEESTEEIEAEETETTEKDEDVRELSTMESSKTYSFSADNMTVGDITEDQLLGEGYFALQCGNGTKVDTGAKTFRRYNATTYQIAGVPITNRLYLGGKGNTSSQSIKFITAESVDVIVYWVSKGANAQMTILNKDGDTVAETFKAAADGGILISRMTLENAGAYYLEGDNYIYKVEVMPADTSSLETDWDFTNNNKFPVTTAVENTGNITSIESKTAEEFHGLYIDTTGGGKWKKNSGKVQVNTGTIIYIPLAGRSKVTIKFGSGVYTVDGVDSQGDTSTFTCVGEGGYATVKVITGSTNFYSIKVEPIETITVSGDITLNPVKTGPYKIIFTEKTENDDDPKTVIEKDVTNNHYEVDLYKGVTYTVSLSDKDYGVTTNGEITVAETDSNKTVDIEASAMSYADVTGAIEFSDRENIPDGLKLKFTPKDAGKTQAFDATINKDEKTYDVSLEAGVTYTVTATLPAPATEPEVYIEDYTYAPTELNADAASASSEEAKITFTAKPKHKINVTVKSFDGKIDVSKSKIIFTSVDGYKYSFTGTENIELRDGTYSISMDVKYPYKLNAHMSEDSKDLVVDGKAENYTLDFEERTTWDFTEGDPMLKLSSALQQQSWQEFQGLLIDTSKDKTLTGSFTDASGNPTTTFTTYGKFEVKTDKRVQVNSSTEIKIPVSGKGTVQIVNQTTTDKNHYTIDGVKATEEPQTWIYDKPEASYDENGNYVPGGYITLQAIKTKVSNGVTASDSIYLQKIIVEREKEVVVPQGPRKIEIWDFGGKVDEDKTDATKYTNNITPDKWKAADIISSAEADRGKFKGDSNTSYTYSFGDLTMNYTGQDRMYSTLSDMSTIIVGDGKGTADYDYTEDGYKAEGGWYCNGSGDANTRNISIENVLAGDKIVIYAGQHLSGDYGPIIYHFDGQGSAGVQKDSESIGGTSRVYKKIEFIAEYNGTYKIWPECVKSGKPLYNRIMRIPGVSVSGTVDFGGYTGSDYTIKFINQTTKQESVVDVKEDKSFEIFLAPGYTYTAVLSDAPGYGFASEGKTIEIAADSSAMEDVKLTVEQKSQYTYSGNLTGFAEGYDISRIAITMVPPADSNADEVALKINKEAKSFTAQLNNNVEYTLRMEGVDDYTVIIPSTTVKGTADITENIVVDSKPKYKVSGGFLGLGDTAVTALKFIFIDEQGNPDNNYVYTASVKDGQYTIDLRDGAYIANATVTGYRTQTHVVVNGKENAKDLFFVSTAKDPTLDRVPDIYVGYSNRPNNYATVREAVKAAKCMNPTSEAQRITIHIAPGVYREQVIVDVPYITFINDDPEHEAKITWYYGIGYAYYSAKGGYYNEESAHDKYEKANATRWGCAVRVAASEFRAENIVFENSFNRYITDEEIADGVELHTEGTDSECTFVREAGMTDAQIASKTATERGAAIAIDADKAEFYECKFYGSQDTVYTGSKFYSYFKDCFIEGNTDFLFGDSNTVYDNCELSFAGYSDTDKGNPYGGIIAVNKAESKHGYLFWGCTITRSKTYNNGYGDLGRPWAANAGVVFVNTKQETADIITATGWQDMSGASAASNPNYKEYNTTSLDGKEIKMESPRKDKYVTENPVEDMTKYFDGWSPYYLTYDPSQVVKAPVSDESRSDVPKGTSVSLTCATEGAKIYYTTDGTDPTDHGTEYTGPISLGNEAKTVTIKAIAIKGGAKSSIVTLTYTVKDAADLIKKPTADVEPGTVDKGTKVILSCETEGAKIYWTKDGTTPTVSATLLYQGQALIVNETITFKAIAEKGGNVSDVETFTYTVVVPDPVDEPIADIPLGEVPVGTKVTLTCETEGATIYYTTDATTPTKDSTEYKGPIDLGNEEKRVVIRAIAVKNGVTSTVATYEYTIIDPNKFVNAPVADVAEGEVAKGTKVTLTCETEGATIYYTKDGTDPTENSPEYTGPIDLGNEEKKVVIKAIAVKDGVTSTVATYEYTIIDPVKFVSVPVSDVAQGEVAKGTKVTLTCETEGATIYYTKDETEPTKDSLEYTGPIDLGNEAKKVVIKAIAIKDGNKSSVATFEYTILADTPIVPESVKTPVSDVAEGEVPVGTKVTLSSTTEGAKIYYTKDGTDPTENSPEYTGPIDLGNEAKKVVIKAIAIKGSVKSSVAAFEYTVSADIDPAKFVSTPVADVTQGEVEKGTKVTLTSATADAKIYYTTNGTDPTEQSKEYTAPIDLGNKAVKVVIKAIAVKDGNKSSVAVFEYTIKADAIIVEPDDPGVGKTKIWITGLAESYAYTGAKITPDIKVWDCDITGSDRLLAPGVDYTVAYKNNVKPGTTAEVIITGKGNYAGKGVTEKFTIKAADDVKESDLISVKGAKIELPKGYTAEYDGTPKYPGFKLVFSGKSPATYEYEYDSDAGRYTRKDGDMNINVAVSGNINKGSATILVTGAKEKNKATSVKASFKITPVDLSKASVTASSAVYGVKGAVPESLTVTCDGKTLVYGRDYTVKYGNNKKVGDGTVTVTGTGNYTKKAKPAAFKIVQLDMSELSVNAVTACENAVASKVKATVVDMDGNELKASQYTLKIYKEDGSEYGKTDKLKADDTIYVEATASAKDANLTGSTGKVPFTVGKDISKAKFELSPSVKKGISYTGSEIELANSDLKVTLKGVTGSLTMGVDYEIAAYSNNINKGTATAVIRGIGKYSGTKTIKFKITQKTMKKGN